MNLAHGAFYAVGAYLTVLLAPHIGFGGALVTAPVLVALLGILIERLLFQRFYRSDPILSLLLTFGLAMVAEQLLRMIFGAPPLSYSIPSWLRGQIFLGDFIYSRYRATLILMAALCVLCLWLLLNRTAFGRVVKAGVQNPDMVGALGISLKPYMMAVAGIGIGLAGLAGRAARADLLDPSGDGTGDHHARLRRRGDRRLGSFWGVVTAALLVGLVKGATIGLGYSQWSSAVIYLMMLLVLLFRPRGLFGERIQRFE